ncbi:hypothetical protein [Congregibacter sp.]|uniref:hypothetical protein n=1 Tax=Congregibacter sp. TaxID=2744308 RepID=UPI003F6A7ADB
MRRSGTTSLSLLVIFLLSAGFPARLNEKGVLHETYESARELPGLGYLSDGSVAVYISFTLNGKSYEFEGDTPARKKITVLPSVISRQGV